MNRLIAILAIALIAACGGDGENQTNQEQSAPPADSPLAAMMLAADPGDAIGIEEAKETAPKDEVVAVGRIRAMVKGYASFQLTDESLDYCGSGADPMEKCPTPWDYCCIPQDFVNDATLLVEARDESGRPFSTEDLPGLRLLDLVAVKGKLSKDEHGNVIIEATGWFRRERPTLHDKVVWPQ